MVKQHMMFFPPEGAADLTQPINGPVFGWDQDWIA